MIPKHKAPHLNRAQRRHPEKLTMQQLPKGEAMPWLLYGLLRKGGFMNGQEVPPTVTKHVPAVSEKNVFGRAWEWAKGVMRKHPFKVA